MPEIKPEIETFAKIKVIGVGGSGGAAINRMVKAKIRGVEFIAANTDVQALHYSEAPVRLHIGKTITRGLGAGMDAEVGRRAAEESQNEIRDALKGADMVFVTCGLGGGTGSGAAPIVAQLARDQGALTVAVVTKPFAFEGVQRRTIAERALEELEDKVDTLITIPNDRLLQIIDKKTSLLDAFITCDEVLKNGVQGISELITIPGLINVDFADVRAIMKDAGSAMMGIGEASGEGRADEAAKAAISSPLLEMSIDGARGILFTVTGGPGLGMHEVAEAAKIITGSADPDAKVIFGAVINENMKENVKITVIATGFTERRKSSYEAETPAARTFAPSSGKTKETERPSVGQFQKRPVKKITEFGDIEGEDAKETAGKSFTAKKVGAPEAGEAEDLDIPAFLRKKIM
ncbi:cell division protein FtsZ [Candidatus Falkowbacteria bacterium]|nr:cell division protein FtsZ [Candidatus Falkowbacteria bacterium]